MQRTHPRYSRASRREPRRYYAKPSPDSALWLAARRELRRGADLHIIIGLSALILLWIVVIASALGVL